MNYVNRKIGVPNDIINLVEDVCSGENHTCHVYKL